MNNIQDVHQTSQNLLENDISSSLTDQTCIGAEEGDSIGEGEDQQDFTLPKLIGFQL